MDLWTLILPGFLVAWAVGGGLVWWWRPERRARRLLSRSAEKPLGAVVEGDRVRVRGVARHARGTMNAHFSGRKCIGFRAVVEEYLDDGRREILRVEHCLPFVLMADGVEARVEGPFLFGLEIDHRGEGAPSQEALDTLTKYGISLTDSFDRPRRLAFFEAALEDGDPVWVLGRAAVEVDPRGQRETLRGLPVLRIFEGTKGDPVILADEDGRWELEAWSR